MTSIWTFSSDWIGQKSRVWIVEKATIVPIEIDDPIHGWPANQ